MLLSSTSGCAASENEPCGASSPVGLTTTAFIGAVWRAPAHEFVGRRGRRVIAASWSAVTDPALGSCQLYEDR
jgi:hypothetical protein